MNSMDASKDTEEELTAQQVCCISLLSKLNPCLCRFICSYNENYTISIQVLLIKISSLFTEVRFFG